MYVLVSNIVYYYVDAFLKVTVKCAHYFTPLFYVRNAIVAKHYMT